MNQKRFQDFVMIWFIFSDWTVRISRILFKMFCHVMFKCPLSSLKFFGKKSEKTWLNKRWCGLEKNIASKLKSKSTKVFLTLSFSLFFSSSLSPSPSPSLFLFLVCSKENSVDDKGCLYVISMVFFLCIEMQTFDDLLEGSDIGKEQYGSRFPNVPHACRMNADLTLSSKNSSSTSSGCPAHNTEIASPQVSGTWRSPFLEVNCCSLVSPMDVFLLPSSSSHLDDVVLKLMCIFYCLVFYSFEFFFFFFFCRGGETKSLSSPSRSFVRPNISEWWETSKSFWGFSVSSCYYLYFFFYLSVYPHKSICMFPISIIEQLLDMCLAFEETVLLWRTYHARMVERMIGRRVGTGGSSGVDYLDATTTYRVFTDLWAVRTILLQSSAAPSLESIQTLSE